MRILLMLLAAVALSPALAQGEAVDPDSVLRVAIIGEPPMLDPMATTVALTGTIAQHMFETLFTVDANWEIVPMLAATMPEVSDDGLTYVITLREGVTFHNGQAMTSADVVTSLERWLQVATRGRGVAPFVTSIEATEPYVVTITLNQRYAPLVTFLAMNTAMAAIMPASIAGSADPITEYVGTGPFAFLEWQPDRYIRMLRFEDYSPRSEPASSYAGARIAGVAELRFVPVPDANTRLAGLLGGEYDYADGLNTEAMPRFVGTPAVPLVVKPFSYPVMVINVAAGALTDPQVRLAAQASFDHLSMLYAGMGDPAFFEVTPSWYPVGSPFYSEAGAEHYNARDLDLARSLLAGSSYADEPVRILTSLQYEFIYRMSLVAAENMREAGFNVDLQVLEWATLTERRTDADAWEAYWTYGNFYPEPTAYSFVVGPGAGNWSQPEKTAILEAMNTAQSDGERAARWADMQLLMYEEAPVIRVGDIFGLAGHGENVVLEPGYSVVPIAYFWNISLR